MVLVQDYRLALVPAMLRKLLPHATIVSFWHIPWGHAEQMGICPWLPELVTGLQGSDIVGFQIPAHGRNFAESARRCQAQHTPHVSSQKVSPVTVPALTAWSPDRLTPLIGQRQWQASTVPPGRKLLRAACATAANRLTSR